MNTMSTRDDFWRDGFCAVDDLIDPAMVAAAVEHMDLVRMGTYETGHAPLSIKWKPGDDPLRICKIDEPHYADETIRALVTDPAIGRAAAEIYGASEVSVWAVQLLYKPSGGDSAASVGWHQDDDYWATWWDGEVFTCWVALSDVTEEAGPVRFVPGSHEWGFLSSGNFHDGDLATLKEGYCLPKGASWEEVPMLLRPGSVSFHHRRTIHGSGPNTSGEPRRAFAVHLRTERATVRPGSGYHEATRDAPVGELEIEL